MQTLLSIVTQRKDLSREQAAAGMRLLMSGEATPAQIGAFLAALRVKGETVDEISGFAEVMREMATPITTCRRPLVDTCGTGGDHAGTFNISTTAAFVVAGAGVAVAKHGNRSATSKCGSADVLEALGVNIDASAGNVGRTIDAIGIGFLFARNLHTAMKHVAAARRELGVPTVFNILGPLTNPAGACGQIIGVFDIERVELLACVLKNLETRHSFVVAGADGLDELTLTGPSHVAEVKDGIVRTYEVRPEDFGFTRASRDLLQGGEARENAAMLRRVLEGVPGPHRDVVLLNAAPALVAGEAASDWREGVAMAARAIDSGAALNKLEELTRASHDS